MQTNLATNNNCFLLCHALVVRICQSPTTRTTTHQNTPTPKSPLLSRMDGSSTRRLHPQISECICITFGMQKREEKDDTATQMASGDITLCPVRAATAIVRRIRSYPGANNDTPISAIWKYDRIEHITSKQISNALRDAVSAIGEDVLHIAKHEIGTHSIRSGAAMAMFLGGCVFLIMMIGRWSSDAFLRYIRKQVEEFNHDVS